MGQWNYLDPFRICWFRCWTELVLPTLIPHLASILPGWIQVKVTKTKHGLDYRYDQQHVYIATKPSLQICHWATGAWGFIWSNNYFQLAQLRQQRSLNELSNSRLFLTIFTQYIPPKTVSAKCIEIFSWASLHILQLFIHCFLCVRMNLAVMWNVDLPRTNIIWQLKSHNL